MLVGREPAASGDRSGARGRPMPAAARRWRFSGPPGIGKTALLDYAAAARGGHDGVARPRHRVRGADPVRVAARVAAPGAAAARPARRPPGRRSGAGVRAATRARPGPLRRRPRRRSDCSPPAPSSSRCCCCSTTSNGSTRPSSEALRFALRRLDADPRRRDPRRARADTARCSTAPRSRRRTRRI